MRLIGSFQTMTTHGRSYSKSSWDSGCSTSTSAGATIVLIAVLGQERPTRRSGARSRRLRRSRRSSSARQRAFSRSYIAANSRELRSHSSRWARRSSGLIFPAIVFLSEQPFELGVDVHQHANDAIDRLAIEDR